MKRNGFTLIEIIAVIVILGIIMLVAVPSVSSQIILARKNSYSTNIKSYMETAQGNYVAKEYGNYLEDGELLLIPISRLKLEKGNTTNSPFGKYIQNESYIIIKKSNKSQRSYINIIDTSGYGVVGKEYDEVNKKIIEQLDRDSIINLKDLYQCESSSTVLNRGVPYYFQDVEYHACSEEARIDCDEYTMPIIRMCQEKVCTITYNLNGGHLNIPNPTVYDDSTKNYILNEPTKEGYVFIGWTGSNGDIPQQNVVIGAETSCQKSYKANWQLASEVTTAHVLNIQYNANQAAATWCGNGSSIYSMDSNKYIRAYGSRTAQSFSYGDSGINLLTFHDPNQACFEYEWYTADPAGAYKINGTVVDQTRSYTATELASIGGCNLANQDCTITANVNWRKTKLKLFYNCNGGTVKRLPSTNTNLNLVLVGATGNPCAINGHTANGAYVSWDESFQPYGLKNHNYIKQRNGSLPIEKEGCEPNDYWIIGSATSPYRISEEQTFETRRDLAQWLQNKSSIPYYDDLKHGDIDVQLYADFTCTGKYSILYELNNGTAGASQPANAEKTEVITISNPTKTITATGVDNGTGALIGNPTSQTQTFAGWTYTNGNTSTAKYGNNSGSVNTAWSNGSTKVTARYFKNLRNDTGRVTLTANWTPVAFNLPTVSKSGYNCNWNTKSDGTGTSYNSGASYTPGNNDPADLTLYAICQHTGTPVTVTWKIYSWKERTQSNKYTETVVENVNNLQDVPPEIVSTENGSSVSCEVQVTNKKIVCRAWDIGGVTATTSDACKALIQNKLGITAASLGSPKRASAQYIYLSFNACNISGSNSKGKACCQSNGRPIVNAGAADGDIYRSNPTEAYGCYWYRGTAELGHVKASTVCENWSVYKFNKVVLDGSTDHCSTVCKTTDKGGCFAIGYYEHLYNGNSVTDPLCWSRVRYWDVITIKYYKG